MHAIRYEVRGSIIRSKQVDIINPVRISENLVTEKTYYICLTEKNAYKKTERKLKKKMLKWSLACLTLSADWICAKKKEKKVNFFYIFSLHLYCIEL